MGVSHWKRCIYRLDLRCNKMGENLRNFIRRLGEIMASIEKNSYLLDMSFQCHSCRGMCWCHSWAGTERVEQNMPSGPSEQYITAQLIFRQALIINEATIIHHPIETQNLWIAPKAMDCSISAYGPSNVERFFPQNLRFLRFHSSFEAVSCDVICQLSHGSWVGSRYLRWTSGWWGNQCHHNSSSELPLKDPKIPLLPTAKWFPRSSWRMLRLLTTNSQLPFKTYALNRVSFATFGCDMMWQHSIAKAALKGVELMTAHDIKHMILLPGLLQTPVSLWHYEWLAEMALRLNSQPAHQGSFGIYETSTNRRWHRQIW